MSHPTDWTCRSCRFVLGQVREGVLRPSVTVELIDSRGVARVRCPRCGRVRVWFPLAFHWSDGCKEDLHPTCGVRPSGRR